MTKRLRGALSLLLSNFFSNLSPLNPTNSVYFHWSFCFCSILWGKMIKNAKKIHILTFSEGRKRVTTVPEQCSIRASRRALIMHKAKRTPSQLPLFPIFEVVWWSTLVVKLTVTTKFVSVFVLPCACLTFSTFKIFREICKPERSMGSALVMIVSQSAVLTSTSK